MFASSSYLDQNQSRRCAQTVATFYFHSGGSSLCRSAKSGNLASTARKKYCITKAEKKCQDFKISVQVFSVPAVLDGTPFHKTNGL